MTWKPKLNPVTVPPRQLLRPEDWVDFIKRYMTDHTSFRENLRKWSVEVGNDLAALPGAYQPLDATLTAFAALVGAGTDRLPYFDSATSMALTQFTASARTIINKTLAKGDLITASAAATAALLAIGATNGMVLAVDSAAANGLSWNTPLRQFSFGGNSSAATGVGARTVLIEGSTTAAARFKVPTSKTLTILGATGNATTGATAGTYTVDLILHNATDTSDQVLATMTGIENTLIYADGEGSLTTPLATLAAGKVYAVGWLNRGTSPGALAATARALTVVGVFV